VVNFVNYTLWQAALAESKAAEPLIERLDPPRRAAVVMALLAITIIGLFLVGCALIGGHWVRRLARRRHGVSDKNTNVENQRLRAALHPILPAGTTGETTVAKPTSSDTVAGK
jgi:hypothetical protein